MIDFEINTDPFSMSQTTYFFKYKFRNMPYLVCDQFGNFFMLPHCPRKRSINFKQLESSKGYVCYNGNKVRMSTLYGRVLYENSEFKM